MNKTLQVESVQLYNISQFEGTKKFKFIVMLLLYKNCSVLCRLLSSIVVAFWLFASVFKIVKLKMKCRDLSIVKY